LIFTGTALRFVYLEHTKVKFEAAVDLAANLNVPKPKRKWDASTEYFILLLDASVSCLIENLPSERLQVSLLGK
jgi:hypothetical protein